MKISTKAMVLSLSAAFLLGCTVALTPQEPKVRVTTNAQEVRGCDYMGSVQGSDNRAGPQSESRNRAIRKMMSHALLLGADTVFQANIYLAYNEYHARGEAFDCSKNKGPETPPDR